MNSKNRKRSWKIVFTCVLFTLVFAITSSAQKSDPGPWDTSINPHDFTDIQYVQNGVNHKEIIWRRNGADGLSVFDFLRNRGVRVIVTVPGYDHNGQHHFWYPLGEITDSGFTDDKVGFMARETAKNFPMYLFPDEKFEPFNTIAYTRQAPLMDNSWAELYAPVDVNPLGIREVFVVRYTDKIKTPEGLEIMKYLFGKNGEATDGTPMIKSLEDLEMLKKYECITFESPISSDNAKPFRGAYALAPVIKNPTKAVIAPDAFLWFSTRNGFPLNGELFFVNQFNCLQKTGGWCTKE